MTDSELLDVLASRITDMAEDDRIRLLSIGLIRDWDAYYQDPGFHRWVEFTTGTMAEASTIGTANALRSISLRNDPMWPQRS